jgi:hypothetical protein
MTALVGTSNVSDSEAWLVMVAVNTVLPLVNVIPVMSFNPYPSIVADEPGAPLFVLLVGDISEIGCRFGRASRYLHDDGARAARVSRVKSKLGAADDRSIGDGDPADGYACDARGKASSGDCDLNGTGGI